MTTEQWVAEGTMWSVWVIATTLGNVATRPFSPFAATGMPTDTDADADSDADTEGDADGDTDTDGDADSDSVSPRDADTETHVDGDKRTFRSVVPLLVDDHLRDGDFQP
jgi:hypothetical protein